jgi:hypothetical protein
MVNFTKLSILFPVASRYLDGVSALTVLYGAPGGARSGFLRD